ncbi:hypothetical protein ElyMa_004090000 [Elysia marginata]|uniref:Uncharacterized protein n=1 Tax=Elysia marginata TaxID=1093978 RepID=A0AAV4GAR3_9GAST|nr:hypothetical protein ElyMa_004090000 [Elysia marginata]
MDVENMLEAEDKLNSAILLDGNYFIMDSEQLVSNPFAELQQEAVQQAEQNQGKKNSMTERLTSVKNNVCEKHFLMASSRLEREKTSRLKQLHDHANKLRHQVKLLDLDKQRHQVEIKRRVEPDKDHSYDEAQVCNTEKRLGANIASFYLEKRLKYPVRIRSVSDISLTPTIQRARTSLRQNELIKSSTPYSGGAGEKGDHGHNASRAQTAKSVSSSHRSGQSQTSGPPRSCFRRRDSRSAPLYASSNRHGSGIGSAGGQGNKGSVLPAISSAQRRGGGGIGSKSATGKRGGNSETSHAPAVVKFAFENPLKILASNEESAKLFAQNHAAYYPGATRAVNLHHASNPYGYSDTSDEDDDEDGGALPDRINLRAMFFNKEQGDNVNGAKMGNMSHGHTNFHHGDIGIGNCGVGLTPHQLALLRKAQGPPPRLTKDMMQGELDKINSKVKTFMNSIAHTNAPQQTHTSRKLSSLLEDVSNKINTTTTITITDLSNEKNEDRQPLPKFSSKGTSTGDTLTSENTNPIAINKTEGEQNQRDSKMTNENTDVNKTQIFDPKHKEEQALKYNWRLIRGREQYNKPDNNGVVRSATNVHPEDLVLQALTGIPINNALQNHVPLHSASRALRHTATFKMHKVVERLISERTKYQRHQVDQLKRQMSLDAGQGGMDVAGLLAAEPGDTPGNNGTGTSGNKADQGRLITRKISQVSIGSGGPDRKLTAR